MRIFVIDLWSWDVLGEGRHLRNCKAAWATSFFFDHSFFKNRFSFLKITGPRPINSLRLYLQSQFGRTIQRLPQKELFEIKQSPWAEAIRPDDRYFQHKLSCSFQRSWDISLNFSNNNVSTSCSLPLRTFASVFFIKFELCCVYARVFLKFCVSQHWFPLSVQSSRSLSILARGLYRTVDELYTTISCITRRFRELGVEYPLSRASASS